MADTYTKALMESQKQKKAAPPLQLVVVKSEYKGNPMLEFRRTNLDTFSMGVKKLETIRQWWEQVVKFLKMHVESSIFLKKEETRQI